jgi:hypothetical protein
MTASACQIWSVSEGNGVLVGLGPGEIVMFGVGWRVGGEIAAAVDTASVVGEVVLVLVASGEGVIFLQADSRARIEKMNVKETACLCNLCLSFELRLGSLQIIV